MTRCVRWGVLGAANFAREFLAPALHAAPGGTLSALATRDPAKAAPFAAMAPGLRVHDSYDALLADPEIDAVYVPLPNHLHVEWTLRALEAGKHVLTEKPVAMTAPEIDDLIAARNRTGLLAAEAYMIVFHPQWQRARDLLAKGAIGRLVDIRAAFSFDNRADTDNIRNKPETGGGAMRDIGVYVLGGARFATGAEPEGIRARIRWENGVDVFTRIDARFGDATYQAMVSTRLAPEQEVVFHGEAGVLRLTAPFNGPAFGDTALQLRREDGTTSVERFNGARQYDLQIGAFNDSVLNGTPYPCPLEFSRGTQAAIDAVFANAEDIT